MFILHMCPNTQDRRLSLKSTCDTACLQPFQFWAVQSSVLAQILSGHQTQDPPLCWFMWHILMLVTTLFLSILCLGASIQSVTFKDWVKVIILGLFCQSLQDLLVIFLSLNHNLYVTNVPLVFLKHTHVRNCKENKWLVKQETIEN